MSDLEDESILNIDADNEKIHDRCLTKQDDNVVTKSTTRERTNSIISADVQLLSAAILNTSKRLDKLEENPSLKGKGGFKRPITSQETDNHVSAKKPAKECLSSMSEQNTLDNEGIQTLLAKVVGDGVEAEKDDEGEILTELQKGYESEDSIR